MSQVRLAPDMQHPWIGPLEALKSEMSEWKKLIDEQAEQLARLEENSREIERALDEAGKSLRNIYLTPASK